MSHYHPDINSSPIILYNISMDAEHYVICVPGLGNEDWIFHRATKNWQRDFELTPVVINVHWRTRENGLNEKLGRVTDTIDKLSGKNNRISLLGVSASGSLMINAYAQRKDKVHKVINNCGRVRPGGSLWLPFERVVAGTASFRESIFLAEQNINSFSPADRTKILTARALFDEVVPADQTPIEGATNIVLPMIEHSLAIYSALTFLKKPLIEFLTTE